jgi:putative two-component system response regulator
MHDAPDSLASRIMIVDDLVENTVLLRRILNRAGFPNVKATSDPLKATELFRSFNPDLVLLDLHMPNKDGIAILKEITNIAGSDVYLPILMLTGDLGQEAMERALSAGAREFVTKPFDRTEILLRIRNLLETRSLYVQLANQNSVLEDRVRERTAELKSSQLAILDLLSRAAEFRDDETASHTRRVGTLAATLAKSLGTDGDKVELIRQAAPLHDIGKIGIPDQILLKPGPLSDDERNLMKKHTVIGNAILQNDASDLMKLAASIALHHHERWDGKGYPNGIAGDAIPAEARMVAISDVFDALTHNRPYRPAWKVDDALAELRRNRGAHFDPEMVDVFLSEVGGIVS